MKEGTTKTGFDYLVTDEKLDNWDTMELLCRLDKGEYAVLPDVANLMLGKEQFENLKKHVAEHEGRISPSITGMYAELSEIIYGGEPSKN